MDKIVIRTAQAFISGVFTGATIKKDFDRNGYITLSFRKDVHSLIFMDVCGSSSDALHKLVLKPKTEKEKRQNLNFIERYINILEEDKKNILREFLKN